jgi:hypothetical protein
VVNDPSVPLPPIPASRPTLNIKLNDKLRRNLLEGHAVMTLGVAALGADAVARIIKTIAVYDDFCHASDPHEEHDFGSSEADDAVIFFKIDYYHKCRRWHLTHLPTPELPGRPASRR